MRFWTSELAKEGFGGVLGVAPRRRHRIRLASTPPAAAGRAGWVGKGITFDSGGLDVKPRRA